MLVLLIILPLLWIIRFKDLRFGYVAVTSGIIALHTSVAIISQVVGIFNFKFILFFHILVGVISIFLNFKPIVSKFRIKIPWAIIATLSVIVLQFSFVHFNYSGDVITHKGVSVRENFNSGYPYFSDEWITVGMSEKSIETGKLPFTNFLNDKPWINFLFVFQSLISEIDLILNVELLSFYPVLSIFFSIVLLSFIYILLRGFQTSVGVSVFIVFLISYLPNSSNLPLLWYLLPWNVGLIFLIAYFIAIQNKYYKSGIFLNIFSIALYPPIIVFALPSFITLFFDIKGRKKKIKILGAYVAILLGSLLSAGIFLGILNGFGINKTFLQAYEFIFRSLNSALGTAPTFIIWRVIPFFVVPFVFWSLWSYRRTLKFITVPIFIGLILWIFYTFGFYTFTIDYHRTVAITSILLIIIASFGFDTAKQKLEERYVLIKKYRTTLLTTILIIFFFMSFSFTEREVWKNFKTLKFLPAPPANQYLIEDDLKLFEGIKGERFLSAPWKGLTLAVVTKNYPVISKPSTLTMNLVGFDVFMRSTCEDKLEIVKKFKVRYVYTPEISCDNFEYMGKSSEGFSLYLVK